jgi:NAD(P)-dependent dehydrogenase (short-subunit alcohol dehydrogenase family)
MRKWNLGAGLESKGVAVIGAAGGIGRELVTAFTACGSRVCAVDLNPAAVDDVAGTLEEKDTYLSVAADIADLRTHQPLLDRIMDEFGRFDVLVYAAAVLRRCDDVDELTEQDWDFQLDVNLKACFFLNVAAARLMRKQGRGGRIVNFASQAWWTGGIAGSVIYAASKGGVVSITRGLARTYAPYGITVNAVSPGAVDTSMMRSGLTEEALGNFIKQIPLGRMAEPSELASTVLFLASDHANYVTGATINVSGGYLMY